MIFWLSYRQDGEKGLNMKTMELNGQIFNVKKVAKEDLVAMAQRVALYNERDLDFCYGRYSIYKANIFDFWKKWKNGVRGLISFGITSYNTNMFVLGGVIQLGDNIRVYRITKAHNIIYIEK